MVERIKEILRKYRESKVRIELGSETGIEEELSRPSWKLEERKRGKSFRLFGVRLVFRF